MNPYSSSYWFTGFDFQNPSLANDVRLSLDIYMIGDSQILTRIWNYGNCTNLMSYSFLLLRYFSNITSQPMAVAINSYIYWAQSGP